MSCNKKHPKFRIHCGLPEGHEGDHADDYYRSKRTSTSPMK